MNETQEKISSGLERAFASKGFAEPSVEDLKEAAGVSLRTLYKYTPSRDDMIYAALDHRQKRYIERIFKDLPANGEETLSTIIDRAAEWMKTEASHGCLFHAAVAAAPDDKRLRALLLDHKAEVAHRIAEVTGLRGREADLTLLLEGLTQSRPLHGSVAVESAKRLAGSLFQKAA